MAPLQPLKIPKYIPFSITRLPFRERIWVWSFRALDPIRDVAIASISSWNQVGVLRTIPSKEREKGLKKEKNKTRVASQKRQRETNIKESKREERMEWKKLNVKGVKKFQRSIDRPALENGFNSRAYAAFRDRWLDFFKNPAGQTITGGPLSSIGLTGYWPLFSLSLSLSFSFHATSRFTTRVTRAVCKFVSDAYWENSAWYWPMFDERGPGVHERLGISKP